MNHTNCPICYEELTVVERTPCIDCGTDKHKIEVLKQDIKENYIHDTLQYHVFRAFEKQEVNLCWVCTLEFSLYEPTYMGFEKNKIISPDDFQFLKDIDKPTVVKDKYCNNCAKSYGFLSFIATLRNINSA